jgi:[ribosomal protein S5]-alanine N-acetyltransferase
VVVDARRAKFELRPLVADDAQRISALAGDRAISDNMLSLPHPFPLPEVRRFVESCQHDERIGRGVHRAMVDANELVGVVAVRDIDSANRTAELSFWVGKPFWGRGVATRGATQMIRIAFEYHAINRLAAHAFVGDAASERVLQTVGFQHEGIERERILKYGKFMDVSLCALLRSQWSDSQK